MQKWRQFLAWTDDVLGLSTPNAQKLQWLTGLLSAVASGTVASYVGNYASNPRQLTFHPQYATWAVDIDGETIVAIEGTFWAEQYVLILDGYVNAVNYPSGGQVNSYILGIADALYPALPNQTALLVGHSIGGAVATVLAAKFKGASLPLKGAVTFGAPKAFTPATALPSFFPPLTNISTPLDPVPYIAWPGAGGKNWTTPGDHWSLPSVGSLVASSDPIMPLSGIVKLVGDHGYAAHYLDNYGDLLNAPYPPPVPVFPLGDVSMAAEIWQFQVKGLLMGQACDNVLYYQPDNIGMAAADVAADFIKMWRDQVLGLVSNQYSVVFYETRQISKVVELLNYKVNPPVPYVPPRGNWRYEKFIRQEGSPIDVGNVSTDDPLPSFNSVKMIKSCEGWRDPATQFTIPGLKLPTGRISIGGITKIQTKAAADGNELTAASRLNWSAVAAVLKRPLVNTHLYWLCIVDHSDRSGQLFDTATPPAPTWRYSRVLGLATNRYISRQGSRAQTISTRG